MKVRYLAAILITGFSLTLTSSHNILIVFLDFRMPYEYRWIYMIVRGFAALLIAWSIRLTNPSMLWLHVVLLAFAWYLGLYCSITIWKWSVSNQLGQGIPILYAPLLLLTYLTGQFRLEYFSIPIDIPISLLLTGFILREISTQIKLKHVVLLTLGGLVIAWGRLIYLGLRFPDVAVPPPQAPSLSPQGRLIIMVIWALSTSAWLYFILARAGWGKANHQTAARIAILAPIQAVLRSTQLTQYMVRSDKKERTKLLLVAVIILGITAYFAAGQIVLVRILLQRVVFYFPPLLVTIFAMITAQRFANDDMLRLVRLTNLPPIDLFAALLQTTFYRIRWIMATSVAVLIALSLEAPYRFTIRFPSLTILPPIVVIIAWLGIIMLGAALGIYATLRLQTSIARMLTPLIILLLALVILPITFGQLGPSNWLTSLAKGIIFSSLPYFGFREIWRVESASLNMTAKA